MQRSTILSVITVKLNESVFLEEVPHKYDNFSSLVVGELFTKCT